MGKVVKISLGTAVLALIVGACFTLSSLALFLRTVFALTRETPVAEVVMSPLQTDDNGAYMDIEFTPYVQESALENIFSQASGTGPERGETESYRVYGDTVAIRGPLISLYPALLILNYSNVYKLSVIEGEYRMPANAGRQGSEFPINGGFDTYWWNFNSQEATYPYNLIVKRFTFSGDEEPGFVGTERKRYEIVVTMDAITWNFIEDVPD